MCLPVSLTQRLALGPFEEANLGFVVKHGRCCSPHGFGHVNLSLDLEASTSRSPCCSSLQEGAHFLDQSVHQTAPPVLLDHLDPRPRQMPLLRPT